MEIRGAHNRSYVPVGQEAAESFIHRTTEAVPDIKMVKERWIYLCQTPCCAVTA